MYSNSGVVRLAAGKAALRLAYGLTSWYKNSSLSFPACTYELSGLGLYLSEQSLRVGHRLLLITGDILQEPLVFWVWRSFKGESKVQY